MNFIGHSSTQSAFYLCSTLILVSYVSNWCDNTLPVSSSLSLRKIMPTEVLSVIKESNGNSSAGLDSLENR